MQQIIKCGLAFNPENNILVHLQTGEGFNLADPRYQFLAGYLEDFASLAFIVNGMVGGE